MRGHNSSYINERLASELFDHLHAGLKEPEGAGGEIEGGKAVEKETSHKRPTLLSRRWSLSILWTERPITSYTLHCLINMTPINANIVFLKAVSKQDYPLEIKSFYRRWIVRGCQKGVRNEREHLFWDRVFNTSSLKKKTNKTEKMHT